MPTFWDAASREALDRRIDTLTPTHERRWGKMTAPQMLAHLTESLRMAAGDLKIEERRMIVRYPPLKQMVILWLPFPKGAPTAPELVARTPDVSEWAAERERLRAAAAMLAQRSGETVWHAHPAFGPLDQRLWGVVVYRHMDHHLRQFGV